MTNTDPHRGARIYAAGARVAEARGVVVLLHGRGAGAEDVLGLAQEFDSPDLGYLAPQAADASWYPYSFLAPIAQNEPWLTSAINLVDRMVSELAAQGVSRDRVVLAGFSQGACLSLEYAARHAGRYGGVVGLSGGLIGPDGTSRDYAGSFEHTPVFLGCSDIDPHIPAARVEESAQVFTRMWASVVKRLYRGMGHTVNRDEIEQVRTILATVRAPSQT